MIMIASMTGYGKAVLELPEKKVTIEIRSLNSKTLDLSTRIPSFYREKELEIRNLIIKNPYDLSALIVLDEIKNEKYEIEINAETYEDIKEEII